LALSKEAQLERYQKFDACVREIGEWYGKHQGATQDKLEEIIERHFPTFEEAKAFHDFLNTPEGQDECMKWVRVQRLKS
jgi:hypothetical protein